MFWCKKDKPVKAKPWTELEKGFKMTLKCEECTFETLDLYKTGEGLLICKDCAEAHDRRTKLKQADDEFDS